MGCVSFAERGGGKGGEGSCSSHCIVMLFIALHWLGLHIRFLVGFSLNLSSYGYVFLFPWTQNKTLNEERKYIQKVCSLVRMYKNITLRKSQVAHCFLVTKKKKMLTGRLLWWFRLTWDFWLLRKHFFYYIYFICISVPFVQEKPHKWWYIFPTIRLLFYRVESCSDVRNSYAVWYFSSVERSRYVKYNGNPIK